MLHRVAKHHRGNIVVTIRLILLSVLVAIVVNVAVEATTSTSSSINHLRRLSSRVGNTNTASSNVGVTLIIVILCAIGFGIYYSHKNKLYCFQDATTTTNGTTATTDKPIETTSNATTSTASLPHERDTTIPSKNNGSMTNNFHESINTFNETAANFLNAANLVNDMTTENNSESTYDYTIPTDSFLASANVFAQYTSSVLNAATNMAAARSSSIVEPSPTTEVPVPIVEEPITEPVPIVVETVSEQ